LTVSMVLRGVNPARTGFQMRSTVRGSPNSTQSRSASSSSGPALLLRRSVVGRTRQLLHRVRRGAAIAASWPTAMSRRRCGRRRRGLTVRYSRSVISCAVAACQFSKAGGSTPNATEVTVALRAPAWSPSRYGVGRRVRVVTAARLGRSLAARESHPFGRRPAVGREFLLELMICCDSDGWSRATARLRVNEPRPRSQQ